MFPSVRTYYRVSKTFKEKHVKIKGKGNIKRKSKEMTQGAGHMSLKVTFYLQHLKACTFTLTANNTSQFSSLNSQSDVCQTWHLFETCYFLCVVLRGQGRHRKYPMETQVVRIARMTAGECSLLCPSILERCWGKVKACSRMGTDTENIKEASDLHSYF